eukprot:TRINITY_DN3304_c0_g1_i2.p1 TRINITY_DN3304_c0_g1~~TRINITY_DN3304_c0_g1_i2.p1  ORF type:complete len:580 (-),score=186.51 TRINITY_DN3304_c0_g1_i2:100-1839(-)
MCIRDRSTGSGSMAPWRQSLAELALLIQSFQAPQSPAAAEQEDKAAAKDELQPQHLRDSLQRRLDRDAGQADTELNQQLIDVVVGHLSSIRDGLVEEPDLNILSLADDRVLRLSLELVICWGEMPLLLPGVGIPLARRTSKAAACLASVPAARRCDDRLAELVLRTVGLTEAKQLQALVISQYLTDVMAGLLQLVYVPDKRLPPASWLERAVQQLDTLLGAAHPLVLVEALTSLLTVKGRPQWLASACSGLLSKVTMRPGGVQAVLSLMLDQEKAHAPVTAHAVRLLCKVPKQCTPTEYVKALSPQLSALLQNANQAHTIRKEVRAAAAAVAAELCMRHCGDCRAELFERWMLKPILEAVEIEMGRTPAPADLSELSSVVDEERICGAVDGLHALLTLGVPNPKVAECFTAAVPMLFRMFVKASSCKTLIKPKVRFVVCTFFRLAPGAGSTLVQLIAPGSDTPQPEFPLMFAPGPSGGLAVRKFSTQDLHEDPLLEGKCAVELLEQLGDGEVVASTFVALLQALFDRMAEAYHMQDDEEMEEEELCAGWAQYLSLIHISEPTRLLSISYAVFCLKKKKK